ncbi:MAG: DUF1572 family protein [Saprospiraceae bacterium]|nr:DUF1572 family protein [Saprospiraceae bacterium]MBK7795828.1 DUF1572 family protein [Saprospiraceae bacterium]MBL0260939.1 DUF1572 family protein [Saprospiraceae bacterium]
MSANPVFDFLKLQFTQRVIDENFSKIESCLQLLDEEDIQFRPNVHCNSIANQLEHLNGNVKQYILHTWSGNGFRDRNSEFAYPINKSKAELLLNLKKTILEADRAIQNLDENEWNKLFEIQIYHLNSIEIIVHVIEHFSYHTGQIIFLTKMITDKDLKFYNDQKLDFTEKKE